MSWDYHEDLIKEFKFYAEEVEGMSFRQKLLELMQVYVTDWKKHLEPTLVKADSERKVIPFKLKK